MRVVTIDNRRDTEIRLANPRMHRTLCISHHPELRFFTLPEIDHVNRGFRIIKIPLFGAAGRFVIKSRPLTLLEECWCRAKGWEICSYLPDEDRGCVAIGDYSDERLDSYISQVSILHRQAMGMRHDIDDAEFVRLRELAQGRSFQRTSLLYKEPRLSLLSDEAEVERQPRELPDGGYWDEEQLDI